MTPRLKEGYERPTKRCPVHGERDQHGIYCNQPMGTRLTCGERLILTESEES
jgi:hypothetical protein